MKPEDVPENVVFVIITDGLENASKEYSWREVKKMVEHEKAKYGWEFLFIGANMDAITAAERLGIDRRRAANYHSDRKGTSAVWSGLGRVMSMSRTMYAMPEDWSAEIDADFADDDRS